MGRTRLGARSPHFRPLMAQTLYLKEERTALDTFVTGFLSSLSLMLP